MAEKRTSLKKVDGEKMAKGVYSATFNSGTTFEADIRKVWPEFDVAPPMAQRVGIYGLKQKLDDSMAGVEDEAEAVEEVQSTWDAIVAGQWTMRVAGEGVEGGLFARAYAAFHKIGLSDAKAKIAELVERNLAKNKAAATDEKQRDAITDRMVFNQLRTKALERYPELGAIYEDLKSKQKKKVSKPKVELDIET
jgi:hypothetical protein